MRTQRLKNKHSSFLARFSECSQETWSGEELSLGRNRDTSSPGLWRFSSCGLRLQHFKPLLICFALPVEPPLNSEICVQAFLRHPSEAAAQSSILVAFIKCLYSPLRLYDFCAKVHCTLRLVGVKETK
ncbi:unnamed protein product [Dracunculus medinensis]|uniref:Uncharacterized protein n=1 Tax=Dracunculus medinensis TaxID=318479 RepID=A0A0N4UET4_DRAME|nr:unnamed protein product [Dracunculus medinensis]